MPHGCSVHLAEADVIDGLNSSREMVSTSLSFSNEKSDHVVDLFLRSTDSTSEAMETTLFSFCVRSPEDMDALSFSNGSVSILYILVRSVMQNTQELLMSTNLTIEGISKCRLHRMIAASCGAVCQYAKA